MFAFVRKVISSFWSDDDAELSLEDAYNIIDDIKRKEEEAECESEHQNVQEETSYTCYHKRGIITGKKSDRYIINNVYEVERSSEEFTVGAQVSFTLYKVDGCIKVTNVGTDEWSSSADEKKGNWCSRTFICKVTKRDGRQLFAQPGKLKIDLDTITSQFVPIVGDWLELQAKVSLDENITDLFGTVLEVETISPLRPRVLHGNVKEWNREEKTGLVSRGVYFNSSALPPGYVPVIGDSVVVEAIESNQTPYSLRALKLIPENGSHKGVKSNEQFIYKLKETKDRVFVSGNVLLSVNNINESIDFKMEVSNNRSEDVTLLSMKVTSRDDSCKIVNPTTLTNIKIDSNSKIIFDGVCVAKKPGTTRNLVEFTFDRFNVKRWIVINLISNNYKRDGNKRGHLEVGSKFKLKKHELIRGQPNSRSPRFVSIRLPDFPVPKKLLNIFYDVGNDMVRLKNEICKFKPILNASLSIDTYQDYFHSLLHLEEIQQLIHLRNYEQDEAVFIQNAEYMMLEIDKLAEKRPSLITGDKIIAKDSFNPNADEYEGYIYKIGANHVYIKFSLEFHSNYNDEPMSVMVTTGRTAYRRMHQGVELCYRNLGSSFLFPDKVVNKDPQVNFTYDQYYDAEITTGKTLTRTEKILAALKKHTEEQIELASKTGDSPSPIKSCLVLDELTNPFKKDVSCRHETTATQTPMKLEWYNKSLNYYQKEAVRNGLLGQARPLPYIIFGPPGTGKTITLVEMILQILRLMPHSRILVATPSNSAANLITSRLIGSNVLRPGDIIRLVAFHCIESNMIPATLMPYCATMDISSSTGNSEGISVTPSGLALGCNSSVIGRHRVTVGTCISCGTLYNMNFPKDHFTHIIVDEAGQATEPEIMVPFGFLDKSMGQVILAGDPQQLGPVVLSMLSSEFGLEETFLDRLLNRFPYARDYDGFPKSSGYDPRLVTKLVYNYRSLPDLVKLFGDLFYEGQLIPTISSTDSKEASILNTIRELLPCNHDTVLPSVIFHGVVGENYQADDCPSWFNPNEASHIFFYVNDLYRLGLKSTDIGIISPYIKQVRQIRDLLNQAELEVPKVGTVEEFQGQEFNVILISTVRSDGTFKSHDIKYKLGFISNTRRINVAITRAQTLMIVVGNPYLLKEDLYWRRIIRYCLDKGSYLGCDLI